MSNYRFLFEGDEKNEELEALDQINSKKLGDLVYRTTSGFLKSHFSLAKKYGEQVTHLWAASHIMYSLKSQAVLYGLLIGSLVSFVGTVIAKSEKVGVIVGAISTVIFSIMIYFWFKKRTLRSLQHLKSSKSESALFEEDLQGTITEINPGKYKGFIYNVCGVFTGMFNKEKFAAVGKNVKNNKLLKTGIIVGLCIVVAGICYFLIKRKKKTATQGAYELGQDMLAKIENNELYEDEEIPDTDSKKESFFKKNKVLFGIGLAIIILLGGYFFVTKTAAGKKAFGWIKSIFKKKEGSPIVVPES